MIAKDALAQANLLPFSPSLKSGLLRRQRLSLAAQSAQPAPAGACGAAGEFLMMMMFITSFLIFPATLVKNRHFLSVLPRVVLKLFRS